MSHVVEWRSEVSKWLQIAAIGDRWGRWLASESRRSFKWEPNKLDSKMDQMKPEEIGRKPKKYKKIQRKSTKLDNTHSTRWEYKFSTLVGQPVECPSLHMERRVQRYLNENRLLVSERLVRKAENELKRLGKVFIQRSLLFLARECRMCLGKASKRTSRRTSRRTSVSATFSALLAGFAIYIVLVTWRDGFRVGMVAAALSLALLVYL